MKAKEFIKGKTLTAVETVGGLILNLVIDESIHGLKVNTSGIKFGTKLKRVKKFQIVDDILIAGSLSVNLDETDMLSVNKD
jgi:hypothetical protein